MTIFNILLLFSLGIIVGYAVKDDSHSGLKKGKHYLIEVKDSEKNGITGKDYRVAPAPYVSRSQCTGTCDKKSGRFCIRRGCDNESHGPQPIGCIWGCCDKQE